MATKAELQTAFERCEQRRRDVSPLEAARSYAQVVQALLAVLPDQHAAVSYQRRYLKSPAPVTPALDLILRYAPPMFQGGALTAVQQWYDSGTKTERAALPDFPAKIETARAVLAHAVQLWGVLAEHPTAILRPTATAHDAAVLPIWISAGVIAQRPEDPATCSRVSDTRRPAVAKCAGCGRERTALLAELLEPATCPACLHRCVFVLTRRVSRA